MEKEQIGISKEEIIQILAEGKILSPSIIKAVYKIIQKNNELVCKNEVVKMDNMNDELREFPCHNCHYGIKFNAKYNDSWYEKPTNKRTKVIEGDVVCSEPIATGNFNSNDGRKTEYYTIVRCPNCNKLNKITFNE